MTKNIKLFSIFLLIILFSCKKKEYTCSFSVEYINPSVSFVGFSESEVKSMVIQTYKANTGFSELIGTDSLLQSSIIFEGDTAFSATGSPLSLLGFKPIVEGNDYKIQCLQTGKTFLITNIASGDSIQSWTQDTHCSNGSGQLRYWPVSFDINGIAAYPGNTTNYSVFFLAN